MKASLFSRRLILSVMVAMVAVVLLATSGSSLNRRNPAFSGVWQDWGDNVWEYYYFAPTDCEYWRFKSNQQVRFAYRCTPGQWWQYTATHGGFSPIGQGGVDNDFPGDDLGYAHPVSPAWSFMYVWFQDCAYWVYRSTGETRFAYKYGPGQWWDYTSANNGSWTAWGHLGLGALTTAAFIGDGEWHTFYTSNMPGGRYLGYTANADFMCDGSSYYWRCVGTAGTAMYMFTYGGNYTGSWYWGHGDGTWYSLASPYYENVDVRYHGGGIFIQNGLSWDLGSDRPADVPSPRTITYHVQYLGRGEWNYVTEWTINNPGSDNKWSGGILSVLWCNSWHWDQSAWVRDHNQGFAEYTIQDAVVFLADFERYPIGFHTMVDWMTLVRDYFREQIRTVMVCAHGNPAAWSM